MTTADAKVELADDLRYIAAHTNDPRNEDRLYEAADEIERLQAALEASLIEQQDRPRTAAHSISVGNSELEPDDRQKQRSGNPDRQSGEGRKVGGRNSLFASGLQRGERNVRREVSSDHQVTGDGASIKPRAETALEASPNSRTEAITDEMIEAAREVGPPILRGVADCELREILDAAMQAARPIDRQEAIGRSALDYYHESTCPCVTFQRYVEDCPKHGNRPRSTPIAPVQDDEPEQASS